MLLELAEFLVAAREADDGDGLGPGLVLERQLEVGGGLHEALYLDMCQQVSFGVIF